MTGLVLIEAEKHLVLYQAMSRAIDTCHFIDECKDIADRSVALAAYYKQIRDDETVHKFNEVRLRAWRRIGQLFSAVDLSQCQTGSAKIQTIRSAFTDDAMTEISDSRIRDILELSALSDSDFEHALDHDLTGSIPDLIRHTPKHQEMVRKNAAARQAASYSPPSSPPPSPDEIEAEERRRRREREESDLINRHFHELHEASNAAMKEVGITLTRKDRAAMKQVVFLIKEEVHAVMRQAAFDQKITMQEILRTGLKMWLKAHGYEFPDGQTR